ncbi:MAG: hypothetical protein WDM90_13155 [Ferruginibacter sp.]
MNIRIFVLLAITLYFSSCLVGNTKCCDYVGTSPISKGLYLESYRTFCAGVFGELTECYITDSSTFRVKVGSYDEHDFFFAKLDGDKIVTYNVQSSGLSDTTEIKSLSKNDLFQKHQIDKDCLSAVPIFGENSIKCDNNIVDAGSYETEDGYYISQVQHKCDKDYLNAVYYTDSSKFSVFIGVYTPGSFKNNYTVKLDNKGNFNFYNIEDKNKVDTTKTEIFLLSDLKKNKLIKVCK